MLEQTLGHITHAANLRDLIGADPAIDAAFAPVDYEVEGWPARVPGFGNWTVRAGLRARRAIRALRRSGPLDALFIHTQVPAILVPDQPPADTDRRLARRHADPVRRARRPLRPRHRGRARRAAEVAGQPRLLRGGRPPSSTWAQWTKAGLVDRYEVPAEKIVVIPPGVDFERWARRRDGRPRRRAARPCASCSSAATSSARAGSCSSTPSAVCAHDGVPIELDLVTRDELAAEPGVARAPRARTRTARR